MNHENVKSILKKMNDAALSMAINKGTDDEIYFKGKVWAFRAILMSVGVNISERKMPMGNTYYFIEK